MFWKVKKKKRPIVLRFFLLPGFIPLLHGDAREIEKVYPIENSGVLITQPAITPQTFVRCNLLISQFFSCIIKKSPLDASCDGNSWRKRIKYHTQNIINAARKRGHLNNYEIEWCCERGRGARTESFCSSLVQPRFSPSKSFLSDYFTIILRNFSAAFARSFTCCVYGVCMCVVLWFLLFKRAFCCFLLEKKCLILNLHITATFFILFVRMNEAGECQSIKCHRAWTLSWITNVLYFLCVPCGFLLCCELGCEWKNVLCRDVVLWVISWNVLFDFNQLESIYVD